MSVSKLLGNKPQNAYSFAFYLPPDPGHTEDYADISLVITQKVVHH